MLYHAVPYVGMAKVVELISIANGFLSSKGVKLPLEPQAVITSENRMEKGLALQKSIFGERIDKMYLKPHPKDNCIFRNIFPPTVSVIIKRVRFWM